ncbi:DUF3617 domain-containing protein [Sphingomonas sp. CJ99]
MRRAIALSAILALAACGGEEATTPSAEKDGAEAAVTTTAPEIDASLTPGQWETTVEMTEIEMPGIGKMTGGQMGGMMQSMKTTVTNCVTEAQARNPGGDLFTGTDGQCTYERFTMKGGKLDGVVNCTTGEGKMRAEMSGSFAADRYTLTNRAEVTGMTPDGQPAKITSTVSGRRIGECTGDAAKAG